MSKNNYVFPMEKLPFRAIVDSINAGFYVVDRQNYRLCFVNQFLKHYKPGIQEGEICYKALRGRKKPCEFCPLTQGKAGKKPIRLEHFEGKDSPAAYISYDNMQSGGRCLFGVSIQFENGQEREPDSCVYYDPILNIKSFDALKFDAAGQEENCVLIIWSVKKISLYNTLFGWEAGNRLLKDMVDWLKEEVDPRTLYRLPEARIGILMKQREVPGFLKCKERFLSEELPRLTSYRLYIDTLEAPLSLCSSMDHLQEYINYLIEKDTAYFSSRHIIFSPEARKKAEQKSHLAQLVLDKLQTEKFMVYYQPIENMKTKECKKCEALARLYDEEFGWIPPAEFIPILESNGLIHELDQFVLRKICSMIRELEKRKIAPVQFHINISAQEFLREDLLSDYLKIIEENAINYSLLRLEITESAMLQEPEYSLHVMKEFERNGISFSMDDFGMGYSNLIRMASLPVSEIKLDGDFLFRAEKSEDARGIYESLLEMFSRLHLPVVAEGVETEEQYHYLESKKVDYVQGYYIAPPLSDKDFLAYIVNDKK